MHWLQNYSALENCLGLTALVATLPISFLFWALAYKRMKGYIAASLALLLMLLVGVAAYGMPARSAVSAALLGMANGIWQIGRMIVRAVFFYCRTEEPRCSGSVWSMLTYRSILCML